MGSEHAYNPLTVRIVRENTKPHLELENFGKADLSKIQIAPIFVQGYDDVNQNTMVKFDIVPMLGAGESSVVSHQTYFPNSHPSNNADLWETADDFYDFLMCLTPKLSRDISYELDIAFSVNGEPHHQTVPAGAGSDLEAVVP
jgi:hypothetical protein